ncbi:MAG: hypothetical protein JSR96_14870 [Proteobacteria bacterium]|nr:hypothetical protein [Pseudomonadota bacterium]
MASAAATVQLPRTRSKTAVPATRLAAGVLALFGLDNSLLLGFLGFPPWLAGAVMLAGGLLLFRIADRRAAHCPAIPLSTLGCALAVALLLLLLGGEGRVFYANPDWQVRDAVLADLAGHHWPFAYAIGGQTYLLRAPLGMYLLPALAGKGALLDLALLASNTVRLAGILALGSCLFNRAGQRWIALGAFLIFSGWDAVGVLLHAGQGIPAVWDHIEAWNMGLQYSSTITLAFWAPNHAIAGWTCAVMYLLWRRGLMPIGMFAAAVPLIALWSPLAAIGTVPFVIEAGITTLRTRNFDWRDVALASVALALALPGLWFQHLDSGSLPMRWREIPPGILSILWLLEIAPLALIAWEAQAEDARGRLPLLIAVGSLMILPFAQIGESADLQMRGAIMPLTILAFAFIGALTGIKRHPDRTAVLRMVALVVLAIGSITPMLEVRRALIEPATPPPLCSLAGVWHRQSGRAAPYGAYLARTRALPVWLAGAPVEAGLNEPGRCWAGVWPSPRFAK